MRNDINKYYYRYLFTCMAILIPYLLIIYALLFKKGTLWGIVVFLVTFPLLTLVIGFCFRKIFFGILFYEADAEKFYFAMRKKLVRIPFNYNLSAQWYMGNYEEMLSLATTAYGKARSLPKKCMYLSMMARAFFDTEDVEALKNAVTDFDALQAKYPGKSRVFSRYPAFLYYKTFLAKDYAQCASITQERLSHLNPNAPNIKLMRISLSCNLAIAYYYQGDYEKAAPLFHSVIETAPKMNNFKALSEKYLEKIERQ